MEINKKNFFRGFIYGFFVGCFFLILIFGIGFIYLRDNPEGKLAVFGKGIIKNIVQKYHPISNMRFYAKQIKSDVKDPLILAKFRFYHQNLKFSGSQVLQKNSLLSWVAPSSDRIPPDEIPPFNIIKKSSQENPIQVIGLKGETLSFQIVLRPSKSMENIMVSVIKNGNNPINCIKIHRFLEIYMKLMVHQGGKHGPLKELINPDPLVPFTDPYTPNRIIVSNFKVDKNKNQPIWIDVHFSRSCLPKKYFGELKITKDGFTLRKIPLEFDVLNATIPQDVGLDRWMALMWTRFWRGEMISSHQEFQTLLNHYFQFAHQYGFATNECGTISPNIKWDWNTGKPISVDWSEYDKTYGAELSGELTGSSPNVWCFPIPENRLGVDNWGGFTTRQNPSPIENWKGLPDIATQNFAKIIVHHWMEKKWPLSKGIVYTFDEPSHLLYYYPDTYKLIADVAKSLRAGSDHKLRFLLTDAPYVWGKEQHGHDKSIMYKYIDIWAPNAATYIPEKINQARKKNKRFWFYQSGPPFIAAGNLSSTGIGFRMWFWTAWKYHVNGVFFWASNYWFGHTKANNPYTSSGGGDGEVFYPGHQLHFLGFPDINGPVPSIRISQWRRGYEDYKYLYMMKQKNHGKEADSAVNSLVERALDDGGYMPYWRNPLWEKPGDWNHDPAAWHKMRVSLAKEIEKLYSRP